MENSTKLVISYFKQTKIVSSPQEAEDFINTLRYRGNSYLLTCSENARKKIDLLFSREIKVHQIDGLQFGTTGGSITKITAMYSLGDTLESHFEELNKLKAIRKEEEQEKDAIAQREKLDDLYRERKGLYSVEVEGFVMNSSTAMQHRKSQNVTVEANDKMSAFEKAKEKAAENPKYQWLDFAPATKTEIEFLG